MAKLESLVVKQILSMAIVVAANIGVVVGVVGMIVTLIADCWADAGHFFFWLTVGAFAGGLVWMLVTVDTQWDPSI